MTKRAGARSQLAALLTGLAAIVVVIFVLSTISGLGNGGSARPATAQGATPEPTVAIPAPSPGAESNSDVEAAQTELAEEQQRISDGIAAYAADKKTPAVQRSYMLSLTQPASAETVLGALATIDGLSLNKVYIWLLPDSSLHPLTGEFDAADIGWDPQSPQAASDFLKAKALFVLSQFDASLTDDARNPEDASDAAAIEQQLTDTKALEDAVAEGGVPVFGFACLCSPAQLDQLAEQGLGAIRVVERTGDPRYQYPVWPVDPLRDQVLSGGTR